jgi:DNA-binding MarR family transcriptional regulator
MDVTDILINIRKIVRSINLESKRVQKEYGVSIPQVLCLSFLKSSPNYQNTQQNIRQFLNLNPSTITGIINRLEKRGFIARLPKSGDKRVSIIALTSSGDKLITNIPPMFDERLSQKLSSLPEDRVEKIETGIQSLIDLLNINEIEANPELPAEE